MVFIADILLLLNLLLNVINFTTKFTTNVLNLGPANFHCIMHDRTACFSTELGGLRQHAAPLGGDPDRLRSRRIVFAAPNTGQLPRSARSLSPVNQCPAVPGDE